MLKTNRTNFIFRQTLAALVNVSVCASVAFAQPKPNSKNAVQPVFCSVHTDAECDCKTLPELPGAKEGGDPASKCKGAGAYSILTGYSATAAKLRHQKR